MSGNIVGLRAEQQDLIEDDVTPFDSDIEAEARPRSGWSVVVTVALMVAALGWIGFVTWSFATRQDGLAALATAIGAVSAPLAVLGILAVLALRTSRSESRRFLSTAQGMRSEASRMERRVAELTARIDANRLALADQTIQLTQIGEEAASRLATVTAAFRSDGEALDRHAGTLAQSASAAGNELSVLLASLPQAQTQTEQIAAALAQAGDAAIGQVGALETQMAALLARGREADDVAGGAAERLAANLERIEGTTATARAQLEQTSEQVNAAVQSALTRAAEALDEARRSVEAQGAAMLAMIDQSQASLDRTGGHAAESLSGRIGEIGAQIETLGRSIGAHDETGRALVDRMASGIAEVEQRLERLDQSGTARTEQLSSAIAALGANADYLSSSLGNAGDAADSFISRSESLLTALDASAREIDETLPAALARLDGHAGASRERIETMLPVLGTIEAGATAALDRLAQTERLLQQQREAIELFGQAADRQLQTGKRSATELAAAIDVAQTQLAGVADGSGPQLIEVMLRVRDAANQAAERARETFERIVPQAAASIGHAADSAISKVLSDRVEKQVLALAEAAEHAVEAANAATARLHEQLAGVSEGAIALEARIETAREQADDGNRESFSRQAALLMEALNSTAIDVAKILSNEVTDSAWAAYLKGDRGVFTRRAVRLLEAGETRAILTHYESDPEFREQVSRYIHDFEAMLRNILATRDGSQVAITLLSSDMGKLYVALAQAIERLRS